MFVDDTVLMGCGHFVCLNHCCVMFMFVLTFLREPRFGSAKRTQCFVHTNAVWMAVRQYPSTCHIGNPLIHICMLRLAPWFYQTHAVVFPPLLFSMSHTANEAADRELFSLLSKFPSRPYIKKKRTIFYSEPSSLELQIDIYMYIYWSCHFTVSFNELEISANISKLRDRTVGLLFCYVYFVENTLFAPCPVRPHDHEK